VRSDSSAFFDFRLVRRNREDEGNPDRSFDFPEVHEILWTSGTVMQVLEAGMIHRTFMKFPAP
jgi:hypothetical protein